MEKELKKTMFTCTKRTLKNIKGKKIKAIIFQDEDEEGWGVSCQCARQSLYHEHISSCIELSKNNINDKEGRQYQNKTKRSEKAPFPCFHHFRVTNAVAQGLVCSHLHASLQGTVPTNSRSGFMEHSQPFTYVSSMAVSASGYQSWVGEPQSQQVLNSHHLVFCSGTWPTSALGSYQVWSNHKWTRKVEQAYLKIYISQIVYIAESFRVLTTRVLFKLGSRVAQVSEYFSAWQRSKVKSWYVIWVGPIRATEMQLPLSARLGMPEETEL